MRLPKNRRLTDIGYLDGAHGDKSSNPAAPVGTEQPASAVARKRPRLVNGQAVADNARETRVGTGAPKRKKPFVL